MCSKFVSIFTIIPTQADYRVPTNQVGHNIIVELLVSTGSTKLEAEQTIATRMTAFNKRVQ